MRSYRRVDVIRCLEIIERIKNGGELRDALDELVVELRSSESCTCRRDDAWIIAATGVSRPMYLVTLDPAKRHWTSNKWAALCYSSREFAEQDVARFEIPDCEVVKYGT